MTDSCAAPEQGGALPASVDTEKETVLQGRVLAGSAPVGGAYVRLLDSSGERTSTRFLALMASTTSSRNARMALSCSCAL